MLENWFGITTRSTTPTVGVVETWLGITTSTSTTPTVGNFSNVTFTERSHCCYNPLSIAFFLIFHLLVSFVVMNLFVGAIIEHFADLR